MPDAEPYGRKNRRHRFQSAHHRGVDELHGTDHTILPDMIEVGSFIGMAAMTKSELTIKNVSHENLGIIPDSFRRLGIKWNNG